MSDDVSLAHLLFHYQISKILIKIYIGYLESFERTILLIQTIDNKRPKLLQK